MQCNGCRKKINDYIDNKLSGKEADEFLNHINSCPECKKELESLMNAINTIKQGKEYELPPDFYTELDAKLYRQKKDYAFFKTAGVIAACLILFIILTVVEIIKLPDNLQIFRQKITKTKEIEKIQVKKPEKPRKVITKKIEKPQVGKEKIENQKLKDDFIEKITDFTKEENKIVCGEKQYGEIFNLEEGQRLSGEITGEIKPANLVIKERNSIPPFIIKNHPEIKLLDFNKYMLALIIGKKYETGYSIIITSARKLDNKIIVRYKITIQQEIIDVDRGKITPYSAIILKKSAIPVIFEEVNE